MSSDETLVLPKYDGAHLSASETLDSGIEFLAEKGTPPDKVIVSYQVYSYLVAHFGRAERIDAIKGFSAVVFTRQGAHLVHVEPRAYRYHHEIGWAQLNGNTVGRILFAL